MCRMPERFNTATHVWSVKITFGKQLVQIHVGLNIRSEKKDNLFSVLITSFPQCPKGGSNCEVVLIPWHFHSTCGGNLFALLSHKLYKVTFCFWQRAEFVAPPITRAVGAASPSGHELQQHSDDARLLCLPRSPPLFISLRPPLSQKLIWNFCHNELRRHYTCKQRPDIKNAALRRRKTPFIFCKAWMIFEHFENIGLII